MPTHIGVAQVVLQLQRLQTTAGFGAGLRRSRQGDLLQDVLRKALRPQRIRLRPHAHPRVRRIRQRRPTRSRCAHVSIVASR